MTKDVEALKEQLKDAAMGCCSCRARSITQRIVRCFAELHRLWAVLFELMCDKMLSASSSCILLATTLPAQHPPAWKMQVLMPACSSNALALGATVLT